MKTIKNFFKKLSKNKNFLPLLIVVLIGVLASRTLIFQKGYFNMHDDLQMMRQLEMEKCFQDWQIPCRWIPDMGYGFGFPLFNFYPPLPYLVGELFRIVGFSFVNTAKLLFAFAIISSGVGMYYLAKEVFKSKSAGVLACVFYVWAPYHAVDVYVRGAMNESWALIFFPLIFLFGFKLLTDNLKFINKWSILLALSYFGLFTSHNLMIMIFTPFFLLWSLLWLVKYNSWRRIPQLAISGILSLGLSAFFTIPAIMENKFTWLKSQLIGYYDYTAHFVTLKQLLFSRFWDYGPSVWLEYDKMSFQIGHVHWILSLIIGLWLFIVLIKKRKNLKKIDIVYWVISFLLLMGWLSAFMTHVRSTPIYQAFSFLALVQFPWRFLTLITFAFSFLAGSLILILKNRFKMAALILISVFLVIFNWNYFLPEHGKMGALTDKEKFSAAAWDLQQTAGIYDYLPATAKEAPKGPQKVLAEVMDENFEATKDQYQLQNMVQGTDWAYFESNSNQDLTVRINLFKFPGWKVFVDDKETEVFVPEKEMWGRMWIKIPSGKHNIRAKFTNTPVRTISNFLSLISWTGLIVFLVRQKKLTKTS